MKAFKVSIFVLPILLFAVIAIPADFAIITGKVTPDIVIESTTYEAEGEQDSKGMIWVMFKADILNKGASGDLHIKLVPIDSEGNFLDRVVLLSKYVENGKKETFTFW